MTTKKLIEQYRYWKYTFKPVNNMGKWYQQVQVDKWMRKIYDRQVKLGKIKKNGGRYGNK